MSNMLTRNDVAVRRVRLLTVPDREPTDEKISYVLETICAESESELEVVCELSTACAVMAISSRDEQLRNVSFEAYSFQANEAIGLQAIA